MSGYARQNSDVNPYAAPQVPDPLVDFAHMGIGVWRDDDCIVMHRDAGLPPFCVKTGEPSRGAANIDATWLYQAFKVYVNAPQLAVPLAQRWRIVAAWYKHFL